MIFIDTSTGTWGLAEDIVLVPDTAQIREHLDSASDSTIIDFGDERGTRLPFSLVHQAEPEEDLDRCANQCVCTPEEKAASLND